MPLPKRLPFIDLRQARAVAASHCLWPDIRCNASHASRRRFIKISVSELVAAPFASVLLSGTAEAVDMVSESDPTATALGYKMDATKASNRKDKAAVCGNCSLYSGSPGASDGPCSVFGGKLVNAKGWCTAWVKKA
jgi:hypothetical protein